MSEADVVGGNQVEAVGQGGDQVAKHLAAGGQAVEQEDGGRRPVASFTIEDLATLHGRRPVIGLGVHGAGLLGSIGAAHRHPSSPRNFGPFAIARQSLNSKGDLSPDGRPLGSARRRRQPAYAVESGKASQRQPQAHGGSRLASVDPGQQWLSFRHLFERATLLIRSAKGLELTPARLLLRRAGAGDDSREQC